MEINENIPPAVAPTPEPNMILTETAQFYLQKAGKWASFLGIMGFIGTGFLAIAALFMGTIFTTMATMNPMMGAAAGMGSLVTVFYLLLAVVSFFFALYLYQFGSRVKDAIAYSNTEQLTSALSKLKAFFQMWGIITIIYIVLMVLIFIFSIFAGIGAASMMNK